MNEKEAKQRGYIKTSRFENEQNVFFNMAFLSLASCILLMLGIAIFDIHSIVLINIGKFLALHGTFSAIIGAIFNLMGGRK